MRGCERVELYIRSKLVVRLGNKAFEDQMCKEFRTIYFKEAENLVSLGN